LPYDEIVHGDKFDDMGLLESALGRPFQTFGGEELYPSLPAKAAALFHSLVCNHCFSNGNKRTAVMTLNFFMLANRRIMVASNEELYNLANDTAEANRKGVKPDQVVHDLTRFIDEEFVGMEDLQNTEVSEALGERRKQKLIDRLDWSQNVLTTALGQQNT